MIWEIAIENITTWYAILIGIILVVGIIGTWVHRTAIPIMWGVIMSLVLYIGATTLEPLIFGYQYYGTYSFQWFLVATFGILFALINITYGYNILTKGSVIE